MRTIIFCAIVFGITLGAHSQNVGQEGNDTLLNYKDINGMKQGRWEQKYYNGNPKYEGYFVDDQPKGEFLRYDSKGYLKTKQFFFGDSLACRTVMFYRNGDTLSHGWHYNKKKDSIWHYYNEEGQLLMIESFDKGVYHGDFIYYYKDGTPWQEITYKNGEKDGTWKRFYPNGNALFEAIYVDGMRQDTFKTFYENGKPEIIVPYVDDLKHGKYLLYDEKGNLLEERNYTHGVADNQDELDKKETKEIEELLKNRGKFTEPADDERNFYRRDQY
ncbi:MAG: toxin-antitoxin system YwqK family antitoxin [Salinivirgaceae bacterium]